MEFRKLGRTGLKVSELCLGTMQFGWSVNEKDSFVVLSAAVEAGINFIDTADIYSRWVEGNPGGVAETIIGKWMKKTGIPREQLIIATKVRGEMGPGPNDRGLSRVHIMKAVEDSLRRLQTDYIDLYQTHWVDKDTPIDETLATFDDLVRQGKVRYIGCSNYPAWRLMEALWTSDRLNLVRFDSLQPNYSLVYRARYERELADVCKKYGLGVIPYSPLAGGFLSGKYQKNRPLPDSVRANDIRNLHMTERNWKVLENLNSLAKEYGKTVSQLSLGWLLTHSDVTAPIIGPRNLKQLKDNLGAAGLRLADDAMEILNELSSWD